MQSDTPSTEEQRQPRPSWPVIDGSYRVGDPEAPVAVCALTSDELLAQLAALPGVAIAGEVQTANLGIERIILNITANPAIRFLLLCGKESKLFRPGQSLTALLENGVDEARRIVGADGYEPVLRAVTPQQIAVFRRQVELVDWMGERDLETLRERVSSLAARSPGRFEDALQEGDAPVSEASMQASFAPIKPGGQREPLIYDPKGYFVITLDRPAGQIVLRHYLPDHTPAHEMKGRSAESMLLGLLREGLISQLSHAGYLGAELAKAETALRLGSGVRYEQDRVLRQEAAPAPPSSMPAPKSSPAISPASTWKQLSETPLGEEVDVVCKVTAQLSEHLLEGIVGEPSEREPFSLFRQTEYVLRVHWNEATQVIMGEPSQVTAGALLRVRGRRRAENEVDAGRLIILTGVARMQEEPAGS